MAQPLLKRKKSGEVYTRPPDVEAEIDVAFLDDAATHRARLRVADPSDRRYLRSETLVHLLRFFMARGDDLSFNAVLPVLLGRCEANLAHTVSDELRGAAQLREDILLDFSELLAGDLISQKHELDMYECRFNRAFRTFRIDAINRAKDDELVDVSAQRDPHGEEGALDDDVLAAVSQAYRTRPGQESHVLGHEVQRAMQTLPPQVRKAVILVHVLGYEVESNDPGKITAATLCGCSGRTIRNLLARAAAALSRFKEDA
jgi:DNA-directed RNA polymerase specialized sigma24 family protein